MNQEIMPAYAAYQKAIDLTLYHAFAELVVQTSQDDKARMHYRQIEAAQIWQQDVDVSIYFEQYSLRYPGEVLSGLRKSWAQISVLSAHWHWHLPLHAHSTQTRCLWAVSVVAFSRKSGESLMGMCT